MPVNDAVTDSVTQVNTTVVGETPAMAHGNLMVSTSHALGNSAHDSSSGSQQSTLVLHTATIQGINSLFATNSALLSQSAEQILKGSAGAGGAGAAGTK